MQHHNYSLTELDNMMPWEREIYVGLLMEWIEEEKRKLENENEAFKSRYSTYKNSNKGLTPKFSNSHSRVMESLDKLKQF